MAALTTEDVHALSDAQVQDYLTSVLKSVKDDPGKGSELKVKLEHFKKTMPGFQYRVTCTVVTSANGLHIYLIFLLFLPVIHQTRRSGPAVHCWCCVDDCRTERLVCGEPYLTIVVRPGTLFVASKPARHVHCRLTRYGDVLFLDTTYKTNECHCPFMPLTSWSFVVCVFPPPPKALNVSPSFRPSFGRYIFKQL